MKRILSTSLAFLVLVLVIGWTVMNFFPERLIPFMLNQQLKQINQNQDLLEDQDRITLFTVGTSSPFPGERAQTGTAVFINGHYFVFDVGAGVVQQMENMRLPVDQVDGVFITHWHSDHFIDLPYLINRSWVLGRTKDLHVYGPDGLDTLMYSIDHFLSIENQHRVDHHGAEMMDIQKSKAIAHEFENKTGGQEVVYNQDGITITAFDVNHSPIEPAVGYVIEYKDKKVVISGDTKKNEMVVKMAQDADLLLHEVMLISLLKQLSSKLEETGNTRNAKIVTDVQDYHTSPQEVAEIAREANVKKLVLHHFAPPPDLKIIENLYRKELKEFTGPIHFANDGDRFVVE